MGRGKLTMELIEKEKARMITYQKRKTGLKKKAQEFATLCGVPTCMIIYGPELNNRPADVDVWPEDQKDFMAVVNLYRDKSFSSVRGVKSQNLFNFFIDRKRKIDYKIAKMRKANNESKFSSDCDDLNQFSMEQLQEILAMFDHKLDVATRKLTMMKGHQILIDDSKHELFCGSCSNSPPAQGQLLFQKNMGVVDVFNEQQPISSVYMQHCLSQYYPSDHHQTLQQMVPFDLNPIDNPMMVMVKGGDQTGNSPYIPVQDAMIDHRTLMMKNIGVVDVFNEQQPISSVYMPQRLSQYYPSDHHQTRQQMVPFDLNPIDNPMMVMVKGGDQTGNSQYVPVQDAMIDHRTLMMNNPSSGVQFFGSTSMQPSHPYNHFPVLPSISSQMHCSDQFNEVYGDINELHCTREKSCKYEYGMGWPLRLDI